IAEMNEKARRRHCGPGRGQPGPHEVDILEHQQHRVSRTRQAAEKAVAKYLDGQDPDMRAAVVSSAPSARPAA
ncbi:hypothetical protein PJP12_29700, partial [Mycobacterium kansasii]